MITFTSPTEVASGHSPTTPRTAARMTTETPERSADPGTRVLGGAMLVALGVSVVVTAAAALLGDSSAIAGAAVGGVSLTVVMAFGTYVVHVASNAVPALSLLVAIMTYALQIATMVAFFLVLERSGALGESVAGGWLLLGVVAASLTWSTAQIWFSTRARIPMYDLSRSTPSRGQEAGA